MTVEAFAALVEARRAGQGRWQARCPAHADRSPSLSIREGKNRVVLVHCFAGCPLEAILAALGLVYRDLFAGPQPSPQQACQAAQERARRDVEARNRRRAHGADCDRLHRLERVADALFAKAARLPETDGDALAALGHEAIRRLRKAESELEAVR